MDQRNLGATGHASSVVTFGAIALRDLEQDAADRAVELVLERGVNHVDVAPTYGDAEVKLGPKLREHRDEFFLGCKTKARTRDEATASLERSLDRMGVDRIDLYQFHAVTQPEELAAIVGPDGALEAFREARDAGVIDHIGLTSHGHPTVILDAIDRIDDLETVMFPLNYTVAAADDPAHDYRRVLDRARQAGLGTIGIKAFAREPWPAEDDLPPADRPYGTWYRPYETQSAIDDCLDFALSQGLTSLTNAGDPKLLPMILDAAERHRELDDAAQRALVERGRTQESPVPRS